MPELSLPDTVLPESEDELDLVPDVELLPESVEAPVELLPESEVELEPEVELDVESDDEVLESDSEEDLAELVA